MNFKNKKSATPIIYKICLQNKDISKIILYIILRLNKHLSWLEDIHNLYVKF